MYKSTPGFVIRINYSLQKSEKKNLNVKKCDVIMSSFLKINDVFNIISGNLFNLNNNIKHNKKHCFTIYC